MPSPKLAALACGIVLAAMPAAAEPGRPGGASQQVSLAPGWRGHRDAHIWFGGWGGSILPARDDAYFSTGGEARTEGGRARFEYDRGYPYDFYPVAAEEDVYAPPRAPRCEVEWTRDRRGGGDVPVRVCRR